MFSARRVPVEDDGEVLEAGGGRGVMREGAGCHRPVPFSMVRMVNFLSCIIFPQ